MGTTIPNEKVTVSVVLDQNILDRLDETAALEGEGRSLVLRNILRQYFGISGSPRVFLPSTSVQGNSPLAEDSAPTDIAA